MNITWEYYRVSSHSENIVKINPYGYMHQNERVNLNEKERNSKLQDHNKNNKICSRANMEKKGWENSCYSSKYACDLQYIPANYFGGVSRNDNQ